MTDRPFDRIADAFLASGPIVLPDRVLDAAFEEVHRTRQRRVLWRAPWRFPSMNTFAKAAVAAVAVIAVGLVGLTFLQPGGTGGVGAPSAAPSPTVAPSATPTPSPDPTAAPLTGQFTSPTHGYTINYPEGWSSRPATAPWASGYVDYSMDSGDILSHPELQGNLWLAVASQPLGDQTREEWEAGIYQTMVDDDPEWTCTPEPITVDGAAGVLCDSVALVTTGGRGYFILVYTSGDEAWIGREHDRAWFDSVLATMELDPASAVDAAS